MELQILLSVWQFQNRMKKTLNCIDYSKLNKTASFVAADSQVNYLTELTCERLKYKFLRLCLRIGPF